MAFRFFKIMAFLLLSIFFILINHTYIAAATSYDITAGSYLLNGKQAGDFAGNNITSVGDINSDGKNDLLISAMQGDSSRGLVYLVLGDTVTSNFSLDNSSYIFKGETSWSTPYVGKVLAGNGDIDGDGISDFMIPIPDTVGSVYVFLGKNANSWSTSTQIHSGSDFYYSSSASIMNIGGVTGFNFSSMSGDVNGDGYNDLLIGTENGPNSSSPINGQACLTYGRSTFSASGINLNSPEAQYPNINIVFKGEDKGSDSSDNHTGYSTDIIPDINGDGLDEILISAFNSNSNHGKKVYLIYGTENGEFEGLNETTHEFNLADSDAIFYSKNNYEDGFGESICGLGDINGDGYGDFLISAPWTDTDGNTGDNPEGAVYVYYGGPDKPFTSKEASSNSYSAKISGANDSHNLGLYSIKAAGDINGDLRQDFIIGEHSYNNNTGRAFVFFGRSQKFNGTMSINDADIVINGSTTGDKAGYIVSTAGDINGDAIDEFMIGAPGYNGSAGLVSIYKYKTNTGPPSGAISSIKTYADDSYQTEINDAEKYQDLYIELKTSSDHEPLAVNIVEILCSSNFASKEVKIRLKETAVNSGTYRGSAKIVSSRSSALINQIAATVNSTVYLRALDNLAVFKNLTVKNNLPTANSLNVYQISTGNTKAIIEYVLYDDNSHNCQFDRNANQVQYSVDQGQTWSNATLSGSMSGLTAKPSGKNHNAGYQPLYWEVNSDGIQNADSCLIRLKPYDGHDEAADYIISNAFRIDNIEPNKPTLDQLPTKNSYAITVTGEAESNTLINIYISDSNGNNKSFASSGNVNSSGVFSVFPVQVNPTLNRITAICVDQAGNSSIESAPVFVTFNYIQKELVDQNITVNIHLALNSANSDQIYLSSISTGSITEAKPAYYKYCYGFDLKIQGEQFTTLNSSAQVTVNLEQAISNIEFAKIYYWNPNLTTPNWSEAEIVVNSIDANQVSFSTNYFSKFIIANLEDVALPVIGDLKINKEAVDAGSYQPSNPVITVDISDQNSGIASWSISLKNLNTSQVVTQNTMANLSINQATIGITENVTLVDGQYEITAQVWDNSIHSVSKSVSFYVSASNFVFSILHAPNPYNPAQGDLTFGYNLSLDATSLNIYIVNLQGDLVWSYNASSHELSAGYHSINWNGSCRYGNLQNGLYYVYCVAKRSGETEKQKLKLAVLQ